MGETALALEQRTLAKLSDEKKTLEEVFNHVANGGSVIDLAETWNLRYSDIVRWLYEDANRKAQYENAIQAQTEWAIQRILKEIRDIGFADIREAFDDQGNLKDVKDMSKVVAATIQGVDIFEEFEGRGKDRERTGFTKKIKFWDKLRAIELLGKNLKMFSERVEHSGKITLEALIKASIPKKVEAAKGPLSMGEKEPVTIEVKAEDTGEDL